MKVLNKSMKVIIVFVLGVILTGSIVFASGEYLASKVDYKNNKTVEDALDDLYGKIPSLEEQQTKDILISSIAVDILNTNGGQGNSMINNLEGYKTLKVSSRQNTGSAGTVYYQIIGYYFDNSNNLKSEYILNTTNTSNTEEIFHINNKYTNIRFRITCTATAGGTPAWKTYTFNGITISAE